MSATELARLAREARRALRNVYIAERFGDEAAFAAAIDAEDAAYAALLDAIYRVEEVSR